MGHYKSSYQNILLYFRVTTCYVLVFGGRLSRYGTDFKPKTHIFSVSQSMLRYQVTLQYLSKKKISEVREQAIFLHQVLPKAFPLFIIHHKNTVNRLVIATNTLLVE